MYNCRSKVLLVPGSSAVEQATVNRLAGGSNPSRGANFFQALHYHFVSQNWSFPGRFP